jgi:hypothetical protein
VVGCLTSVVLWTSLVAADSAAPLVFNTTPPTNHLQGTLSAEVRFAQSQLIPATPRKGDSQPHLVGLRRTLLLVRPLKPIREVPMEVTARDRAGKELGRLTLDPPEQLPITAYHVEGLPDEPIDFTAPAAAGRIIENRHELERLSEPESTFLNEPIGQHALIEIHTANGRWVRDLYVPSQPEFDGKLVRIRSQAAYESIVHYSGRSATIADGQTLLLKAVRGQWLLESDLENQGLTYAEDTWSGVLPAEWITPGLSLLIQQGKSSGKLTKFQIGAPTELLIHTIDIGMLTPRRDKFRFANDPSAHREYFQTVPVSRLIVSQYAPLELAEVRLPNGTLLTDHDPTKGDWHNGEMRQRIGKELISLGIDNANYGIHSTPGEGEASHPYIAAQLTAHNSTGNYANGVVVHGGSGGGGIVTLDDSLGNEFSHEVGHNYGLGHYVGGFQGSVHRTADQPNSTWGWDADHNRFIPNFAPTRGGEATCLENECQPPFDGRSFGKDAMAGGAPLSGFHRFTLYTPHSAAIIQQFLESKAVFDAASPTGFSQWNDAQGKLLPYRHTIDVGSQITPPAKDIEAGKLPELLTEYGRVNVVLGDGNWTRDIVIPPAMPANRGRAITIHHDAGYGSTLFLNGRQLPIKRGFQKRLVSDGQTWKPGTGTDLAVERKPQQFGVPVTTLVGYYDPDGQLPSTIYPALHGAYGFTYADDGVPADAPECQLLVKTGDGELRFRLADRRLSANVMNKFHVNVPTASAPESVAVVCRGKTLDSRPIAAATENLTYTVNGRPLARE